MSTLAQHTVFSCSHHALFHTCIIHRMWLERVRVLANSWPAHIWNLSPSPILTEKSAHSVNAFFVCSTKRIVYWWQLSAYHLLNHLNGFQTVFSGHLRYFCLWQNQFTGYRYWHNFSDRFNNQHWVTFHLSGSSFFFAEVIFLFTIVPLSISFIHT